MQRIRRYRKSRKSWHSNFAWNVQRNNILFKGQFVVVCLEHGSKRELDWCMYTHCTCKGPEWKLECSRVCIFEGRTVLSKVGGFYHNRYLCRGVFRLLLIHCWNYTCIYLYWLPASSSSTIYLQKLKFILRSIFYHVCLVKDGNFFRTANGTK